MPTQPRRHNSSRLETWGVFACATAVGLIAGVLAWRNGLADWSALAALSHALDVCHKEPRFNLALMGFVAPPLPTLLYLPFAGLVPPAATSGLACPILGALMLGGCAALFNGFCAGVGLGRVRWVVVAALVLDVHLVSLAALGSPGIVLAFSVIGGAGALMRWAREQNFRDLVTCSLMMAAAVLTRYDAIWLVATATLFIAWRTYRTGDGWPRAEGTLISFLMPIVYCYAVWVGANWAIMGDPWHFLRESIAGPSAGADVLTSLLLVVGVSVAACPLLFGLLDHEIRGVAGSRPPGRAGAWPIVGALLGAGGLSFVAPITPGDHSFRLLGLLVPCLVIGLMLLAAVLAQHIPGKATGPRTSLWTPLVLAAVSVGIAGWAQKTDRGLPYAGLQALAGRPAFASDVVWEIDAAGLLAEALAPGQRLFIAGRSAFAVSLFVGVTDRTMVCSESGKIALSARPGDMVALEDPSDLHKVVADLISRGLGPEPILTNPGNWSVFQIPDARPAKGKQPVSP